MDMLKCMAIPLLVQATSPIAQKFQVQQCGNTQLVLAVTWNVVAKEDGRYHLALEWRESEIKLRNDSSSGRRGFGRRLIEQALPYQLDASTRFELLADACGVRSKCL
jgi:hypothetical protein